MADNIAGDVAGAMVEKAGRKHTMAEAGYKHGTKAEHCGICVHYVHPHVCELVAGNIFPAMWCRYYEKREARK